MEELQTTADDTVDSDDDDTSTDMEESEPEEFDEDIAMDGVEVADAPLPTVPIQVVLNRPARSTRSAARPSRFQDEHTGPDWWEHEDAE